MGLRGLGGLGLAVQGLGLRVQGSGVGVQGLRIWVVLFSDPPKLAQHPASLLFFTDGNGEGLLVRLPGCGGPGCPCFL